MLLPNDYGYFSDDGREYVITRPDTPAPWINVLSNGDYGLVLSQAGSGYSWRTHASLNRITRWSQDLVCDDWGKYLYIRDVDSGAFAALPIILKCDVFVRKKRRAVWWTAGPTTATFCRWPHQVPCRLYRSWFERSW